MHILHCRKCSLRIVHAEAQDCYLVRHHYLNDGVFFVLKKNRRLQDGRDA